MNPLIVIDTETGGLDPRENALLEVGAIYLGKDGVLGPTFSTLILPRVGYSVTAEAMAVNRIANADLAEAPALAVVQEQWLAYLRDVFQMPANVGEQVQFAAWNVGFDSTFLYENKMYTPSMGKMVCLWSLARAIYPGPCHLKDIAEILGVNPVGPLHRALTDARLAAEVGHRLTG